MPEAEEKVRLKPRAWRVLVLFVGLFAAILLPIALLFVLGFTGPPPYILERGGLESQWFGEQRWHGSLVEVIDCGTPAAARLEAGELHESTDTARMTKTLHIRRYVRADDGRHGLIIPLDELVLRIEAGDRAAVDWTLEHLPFVRENPRRNVVYTLFTRHPGAALIGIFVYAAALALLTARVGSWAATIEPPKDVRPAPADELTERLLSLQEAEVPFTVERGRRGKLVARWRLVDSRWTSLFAKSGLKIAHVVKMRLDPQHHEVHTTETQRKVRWRAGAPKLSYAFSLFKGITFAQAEAAAAYGLTLENGEWRVRRPYSYSFDVNELKAPLIETVIRAGWRWKPVVTLIRPLGG